MGGGSGLPWPARSQYVIGITLLRELLTLRLVKGLPLECLHVLPRSIHAAKHHQPRLNSSSVRESNRRCSLRRPVEPSILEAVSFHVLTTLFIHPPILHSHNPYSTPPHLLFCATCPSNSLNFSTSFPLKNGLNPKIPSLVHIL